MIDVIPTIDRLKEKIHETIAREVVIMRNLLTSLRDEHNAIASCDENMLDQVLEERLDIISSFEQWSAKLIQLTIQLANETEVSIKMANNLRHCEAIEILQECLNPDDFELLYYKNQVEVLVEEVHHQNNINAYLLQKNPPLLNFRKSHPIPLASPLAAKKAKSTVGLIEQ